MQIFISVKIFNNPHVPSHTKVMKSRILAEYSRIKAMPAPFEVVELPESPKYIPKEIRRHPQRRIPSRIVPLPLSEVFEEPWNQNPKRTNHHEDSESPSEVKPEFVEHEMPRFVNGEEARAQSSQSNQSGLPQPSQSSRSPSSQSKQYQSPQYSHANTDQSTQFSPTKCPRGPPGLPGIPGSAGGKLTSYFTL